MGYGCTCCSRTLLVELNFIMMLTGLAMVGLLLWIRFDNRFENELKTMIFDNSNYNLLTYKNDMQFGVTISWYVLGGFGIAASIIGFFGVCGSCCNFRCLNGFYMILLIIMSLLEIAAGVFIFIWRTNIYQSLYGYISAVFQMQASDLYTLRNRFNCCGNGIPNSVCTPTDRPCTTEITARLDGMFLIAGIILIGILALQLIAIILAGAVVCCGKSNKVQ